MMPPHFRLQSSQSGLSISLWLRDCVSEKAKAFLYPIDVNKLSGNDKIHLKITLALHTLCIKMEVGTDFKLILRDGLSISKTESGDNHVNASTKLTCHVVVDVSTPKNVKLKDIAS